MRKISFILIFAIILSLVFVSSVCAGAEELKCSFDQLKLTNDRNEELTPYNLIGAESVNVSIPVCNEGSSSKTVLAMVALFNSDGNLVSAGVKECEAPVGFFAITPILAVTETLKVGDAIKVIVWEKEVLSPILDVPYEIVGKGEYVVPEETPTDFKWEAESYTATSGGITTTASATATVQGEAMKIGKIGSFDVGDWMKYENVDFGDGYSRFAVMLGSTIPSASFQIIVGDTMESGTVIGTYSRTVAPTSGFGVMEYFYTDILNTVKGKQTVFIRGTLGNGIGDIDHFRIFNENEEEGQPKDEANVYVNNTDTSIVYDDMSLGTADGFMENDVHVGTKNGASLEYDFMGRGIDVIAKASAKGGKIRVIIDGNLETVVDTKDTSTKQKVVYTVGGLTKGTHRIRLEKLGGEEVAIDGFKVYADKIKIACIGDGITFSTTLDDTDYYPQQLGTMLGEGFEVCNFGKTGTTVMNKTNSQPYTATTEYTSSLTFLPDVVVIMLGTNDSASNRWGDKQYFVESYKSIIEAYKNLASKPVVYVNTAATEYDSSWDLPDSIISGEMKDMIIQAAEQTGCDVIDINAATKNVPDFYYDKLYPNKTGCELIAKTVLKKLPVKQAQNTVSIEKVKGGKDAMYTLISDDGYWVSSQFFDKALGERELKGTIAYIVKNTASTEGDGKYGTVAQWNELLAEGNLDIANHSQTHQPLNRSYYTGDLAISDKKYSDKLEAEINTSQINLKTMFPGQKVLGFVLPYNTSDENVVAKVKENHYAIRGDGGVPNSIDPTEAELFAVKSYDCNGTVEVTTMNGWVDNAIKNKKWIVEMWHGIEGDHSYKPPTEEHVEAHLDYVKSKEDNLWVASFNEAIQYIRERQTARVVMVTESDTKIEFILNDMMEDKLFDYPLTVRINVPFSWNNVSVSVGGATKTYAVTKSGTDAYILLDVVPDKGITSISKAN